MLSNAGHDDVLDEGDYMTEKVLLYDLSKWDDAIALVERILLMRNSGRKAIVASERGRWIGKQESRWSAVGEVPCEWKRPRAYGYYMRKVENRGSGLRAEIEREDVGCGKEKKKFFKGERRAEDCGEGLRTWVLWRQQDKVNETLVEGVPELEPALQLDLGTKTAQPPVLEVSSSTGKSWSEIFTDDEDDEELVEPVTPPSRPVSLRKCSFTKGWAETVEEIETGVIYCS